MTKNVILGAVLLSSLSFAGDGSHNIKCVSGSGKTKVNISYSDSGAPVASLSIKEKDSNEFKTLDYSTEPSDEVVKVLQVTTQLQDKVLTVSGFNSFKDHSKNGEDFEFWAIPNNNFVKKESPEYSKKYSFDAKVSGTDPRTGEGMNLDNGQTYIDVSCTYYYSL